MEDNQWNKDGETVKNAWKKTTGAKTFPIDRRTDGQTYGQRDCCMDKGIDGKKDRYSLRDSWMRY